MAGRLSQIPEIKTKTPLRKKKQGTENQKNKCRTCLVGKVYKKISDLVSFHLSFSVVAYKETYYRRRVDVINVIYITVHGSWFTEGRLPPTGHVRGKWVAPNPFKTTIILHVITTPWKSKHQLL